MKARQNRKKQNVNELNNDILEEGIKYNIINEPTIDEDTLVIIGNGFDLAHGIPSSYYSFRDKCNRQVKTAIELFIDCDDVWGDFENNLAYLDREKVIWDMWDSKDINGVLDEEDDDFSAADFFMSIEDGGWGISAILNDLPKAFRRWINTLDVNKERKYNLPETARYLNFNYTETLETVYSIPSNQIAYIHGDRRNKKDVLILGHGHNIDEAFEEWYNKNKDRREFQPYQYGRKGRRFKNDNPVYLAYFLEDEKKGNWHSQTNYDYIENCVRIIEDYYEDSAKKTSDVIEKYKNYFASLRNIRRVVTMGFSMSEVDIPYIEEIHKIAPGAKWQIGYHSLRDYKRIEEVEKELGLSNMEIFRV